jgi:hypothetical protein
MRNSRDIGLKHGTNGKGDNDRTQDHRAFRDGYNDINWHRGFLFGFKSRGHTLVKTYGAPKTESPVPFTGILRGPDVTVALIPDERRTLIPILYKRAHEPGPRPVKGGAPQ